MNVQELIDKLQEIEDKTKDVVIWAESTDDFTSVESILDWYDGIRLYP